MVYVFMNFRSVKAKCCQQCQGHAAVDFLRKHIVTNTRLESFDAGAKGKICFGLAFGFAFNLLLDLLSTLLLGLRIVGLVCRLAEFANVAFVKRQGCGTVRLSCHLDVGAE